jgi:DNA repair protein SbcD/Mre11
MNKNIRIAHASDLHYCEKHLQWVDKAFGAFVDGAIEAQADVAIISGDSFDHQLHVHDPATHAFLRQVSRLAGHMPILVLQGTFSHDRPGSLEVLRTLAGKHPVFVADKVQQVALLRTTIGTTAWLASEGYRFETINADPEGLAGPPPPLIVSCLPSIHKGQVKAMAGEDATPAQLVEQVCASWAEINLQARAAGIPTVLVTHGTVNGSVTESRYAMVSPDHEFSPGVLFGAQASAVMVGHIHAHNAWDHEGRRIAYPGSITRLIHGHNDPTYWLDWTVMPDGAVFECIPTPARELIAIDFNGPPDMDELRAFAPKCADAYVRVRWSVDEEHRHTVDAAAIREILAAACEVKLEGRTNPVQRTRAEGLTRTESLSDKLTIWGAATDTDTSELQDRLADLQIHDTDTLLSMYATKDVPAVEQPAEEKLDAAA